ncbi:SRSO17 transposase [Haloferula luteola]|uniref:SRSO17 transposase n=1 Tax=Haloferula luteola TaxID=595692 RepID=A0A840V8H1_9BACT|nr:transposase [Haloferula luteola]MBB5354033.1 SRSO17 transposase [Haloferula luteola]
MCITDFRLYLPESWAEDEDRCRKAKIPEGHRIYHANWLQALEMVAHARKQGLKFGWIGADSLDGSNAKFLNAVEDLGEKFMGDVNKTTKLWCSKPRLEEVAASESHGHPRKHARLSPGNPAEYVSVGELASRHFE